MRYHDALYGEWELPEILEKLIHTRQMIRLRDITQSVMPNSLVVRGPMPSRFQHGLGVSFLAQIVLEQNPGLNEYETLLPVAALLHDAGNPPFSHLSESFLKEITGHDGESFLAEILDGSETEKILREYGIRTEDVVSMVTGSKKPISEVLHGSMDIDNLDNVGRFADAARIHTPIFNAKGIASRFRFAGEWFFLDAKNLQEMTGNWQNARKAVYKAIYSAPHLNLAMMLQRAVELAHSEEELEKDFFFLDDYAAMRFLKICNAETVCLVNRALRWEWYDEVLSLEYSDPPEKVKLLAAGWRGRRQIANMLAGKLRLSPADVCAWVSRGNESRKITIPFVSPDGSRRYDTTPDTPIYRVKVYMPKTVTASKELMRDLVLQEIS